MSYSRATHTPASPSFPTDGSYFPTDNNGASPNPHPFRYSRDQILGLFDEDKLKSTPIELVELLEQGSVLVAQHVNRPVGMRDLTDAEKKVCCISAEVYFTLNGRSFLLQSILSCLDDRSNRPLPPPRQTRTLMVPPDDQVPLVSPEIPLNPMVVASATLVVAKAESWLQEVSSRASLVEEQ